MLYIDFVYGEDNSPFMFDSRLNKYDLNTSTGMHHKKNKVTNDDLNKKNTIKVYIHGLSSYFKTRIVNEYKKILYLCQRLLFLVKFYFTTSQSLIKKTQFKTYNKII